MSIVLQEKEKILEIIKNTFPNQKFFLYFNKNNEYLLVSNITRFNLDHNKLIANLSKAKYNFKIVNNLLYINPNYLSWNIYNNKHCSFDFNNSEKILFYHLYRIILNTEQSMYIDILLQNKIIKMKYISEHLYYKQVIAEILKYKSNEHSIPYNIKNSLLDILI